MHQGRRGDQGIPFSPWVRHMQGSTAKRYRRIDGQGTILKLRQDVMGHPGSETSPLSCIAPFDPEDA